MTEEEFRQKYPHSTDEQVRLYCEAVQAEQTGAKPPVEPDILMPMITAREPGTLRGLDENPRSVPIATTYASNFFTHSFSLADVPPEAEPTDCAAEMRAILLGNHGFNGLSPEMRQRLAASDMSENEMLAMLVGAPSAREFRNLA